MAWQKQPRDSNLGKLGNIFQVSQASQGAIPLPKVGFSFFVYLTLYRFTIFSLGASESNFPKDDTRFSKVEKSFSKVKFHCLPSVFYCQCGLRSILCPIVKLPKLKKQLSQGGHGMYHSFPRCSKCRAKFSEGPKGFPRCRFQLWISQYVSSQTLGIRKVQRRFQDSSWSCRKCDSRKRCEMCL